MSIRQKKVEGRLQEIISEFLNREGSTQSIITVTGCDTGRDFKNVVAFISVFPESFEQEALDFARRKRGELRSIIKEKMPMKVIPFIDFEIDAGEKNRQAIEQILGKI